MANGTDQNTADQKAKDDPAISIVNTISIIIVVGYIAWMPLWMFFPPTKVPPEILAILNNMIGAWGYAFAAVIGYHIGSTKTGKDAQQANRETMNTLARTAATPPIVVTPAVVDPIKTVDTRTQTVVTEPAPQPPDPPTAPAPPKTETDPVVPENNTQPKF